MNEAICISAQVHIFKQDIYHCYNGDPYPSPFHYHGCLKCCVDGILSLFGHFALSLGGAARPAIHFHNLFTSQLVITRERSGGLHSVTVREGQNDHKIGKCTHLVLTVFWTVAVSTWTFEGSCCDAPNMNEIIVCICISVCICQCVCVCMHMRVGRWVCWT